MTAALELRRSWPIIVAGGLIHAASLIALGMQFRTFAGAELDFRAAVTASTAGSVVGYLAAAREAEKGRERIVILLALAASAVFILSGETFSRELGPMGLGLALGAATSAPIVPVARIMVASFDHARTLAFAIVLAGASSAAAIARTFAERDEGSTFIVMISATVVAAAALQLWIPRSTPRPPEPLQYSPVGPAPILGPRRLHHPGRIALLGVALVFAGVFGMVSSTNEAGGGEIYRYVGAMAYLAMGFTALQWGDLVTLRFTSVVVVALIGARWFLPQAEGIIGLASYIGGRTAYSAYLLFLPILVGRFGPFNGFSVRLALLLSITEIVQLAPTLFGYAEAGASTMRFVALGAGLAALFCVSGLTSIRSPARAW